MNAWELVLKAMAAGYQVEVEQDGMVVRIRRGEATEAEPKPKKKPVKIEPKRIDHAKIIALWDTGTWSVAKIADEMGCSEQTVRNHLEKEGK